MKELYLEPLANLISVLRSPSCLSVDSDFTL